MLIRAMCHIYLRCWKGIKIDYPLSSHQLDFGWKHWPPSLGNGIGKTATLVPSAILSVLATQFYVQRSCTVIFGVLIYSFAPEGTCFCAALIHQLSQQRIRTICLTIKVALRKQHLLIWCPKLLRFETPRKGWHGPPEYIITLTVLPERCATQKNMSKCFWYYIYEYPVW